MLAKLDSDIVWIAVLTAAGLGVLLVFIVFLAEIPYQVARRRGHDAAVARRLGRTQRAVKTRRLALGIAPVRPRRRVWTCAEVRLLGRLSDAAVAQRLGISRRCAMMERRRRGLAASSPKNRPRHLGAPAGSTTDAIEIR